MFIWCNYNCGSKGTSKPRLSIDITTKQHQHLKAAAALNSRSIKEFMLSRTFRDTSDPADMDGDALGALRDFLEGRMMQVREGKMAPAGFAAIRTKAMQLKQARDA